MSTETIIRSLIYYIVKNNNFVIIRNKIKSDEKKRVVNLFKNKLLVLKFILDPFNLDPKVLKNRYCFIKFLWIRKNKKRE